MLEHERFARTVKYICVFDVRRWGWGSVEIHQFCSLSFDARDSVNLFSVFPNKSRNSTGSFAAAFAVRTIKKLYRPRFYALEVMKLMEFIFLGGHRD